MRAQRGAGGLFILIIISLVMIAVLALGVFLRMKTNVDEATQTTASLNAASAALEQYRGAQRDGLPCPAEPRPGHGDRSARYGVSTCLFRRTRSAGTIPWTTIGLLT